MSNTTIRLTDQSYIWVRPLVFQAAGNKKIFLGDIETKRFIVVDAKWYLLAELLKKPIQVTDIARQLLQKDSANFNPMTVNTQVKLMLLFLAKHGLLFGIDNHMFTAHGRDFNRLGSWVPTDAARTVFHPFVFFIFPMAFLLAIMFPLGVPSFFPKPSDFFWHSQMSISLLTYFLFSWFFLYLHELGHTVAAQAYGVTSSLRLSYRLLFLVVETTFDDIYKVSRKHRIAIYVAGMEVDFVVIALCYLVLAMQSFAPWLISYGWVSAVKQIILLQWLTIVWQFFFFMKTDVYYVIKELLQIENLYTLGLARIEHWLYIKKHTQKFTSRDSLLISLYALFVILGTAFAIGRYMLYNVPITFALILLGLQKVLTGVNTLNYAVAADGGIVLIVELLYYVFLAVAITSKKNNRLEFS